MAKVTFAALLIGLVVWLGGYREATNVAAQSGTVVWSKPILLSDPKFMAWNPAIVADMAGNVHLMWSQTMSENPPAGQEGDTLFYACWDGEHWSSPVDVLVSPQGAAAEFPDLAVTPEGMLHAVWGTGGNTSKLMYARAPACCADHPKNWSQPVSLGMPVNLTTALVADDRGRLHAAFASLETDNIVYRRSDDGGITWPVWVNILGGMHRGDEYAAYPRLAVDGRGRVHAVWTQVPWPGRLVMYARSDDGGDTWSEPQVIDSVYYGHYAGAGHGPIFVDVETFGEDEVHLIWDGAPTVERNHLWSSDGGESWSAPSLLFPEISGSGRAGWNDMVVDSAGKLHAVALGQPFYASWSGGAWSPSTPLGQGREKDGLETSGYAEWMRIALSLGNQLHVVWVDKKGIGLIFPVWYIHGEIVEAPAVAAQPLPVPTPTLLPTPTVSAYLVSESPTPTLPTRPVSDNTLPSGTVDPMNAVLWGVIPALVIVSIVLVFSTRQVQRRQRG